MAKLASPSGPAGTLRPQSAGTSTDRAALPTESAALDTAGLNLELLGCYENNLQVHMEHSFLVTAAVPETGGLRIINAYHNDITCGPARPVRMTAPTLSSTARASRLLAAAARKDRPVRCPRRCRA